LNDVAVETINTWRFEPGTKAGKPVAVEIAVEVDFKLYK
jgi:outer membrane biosynthesis protein TonB